MTSFEKKAESNGIVFALISLPVLRGLVLKLKTTTLEIGRRRR